jgi:hypothetical protein
VETYSSLKLLASLKACSRSLLTGDFRQLIDFGVDLAQNGLRADADFFEDGGNDAFFVFEESCEQMDRLQLGIAVLRSELAGALDSFLRFDGKFVPTDGHGSKPRFGN